MLEITFWRKEKETTAFLSPVEVPSLLFDLSLDGTLMMKSTAGAMRPQPAQCFLCFTRSHPARHLARTPDLIEMPQMNQD
jgi:hypothetical protein